MRMMVRAVMCVMLHMMVRCMAMMGSVSRRLCEGRAHAQQHHARHQGKLFHRLNPRSRTEWDRTAPVSPLADPADEAKANFMQRL
jgi:hypothetical protein